jgi:acetyl esterase
MSEFPSIDDMRRMVDEYAPLMNADLPEVGAFHAAVPVRDGVTADVIVPGGQSTGQGPHPVLVYLHGGGWVCGSARTHRKLAYRFAEAGYLVFNVNYRLAPEHPFPTPFQDCLAAARWACREAARFGGDGTRLAVGGDSAGANLAAAVAAELAGTPERPKAALLLYGIFDFELLRDGVPPPEVATPAADAARGMVEMMMGSYLSKGSGEISLRDPQVSPLHAAAKLPPSHIVVGGADPLSVQAEALVNALAAAGVPHEYFVDAGMPHGYVQMEFLPAARPAIDRMVAFLRLAV